MSFNALITASLVIALLQAAPVSAGSPDTCSARVSGASFSAAMLDIAFAKNAMAVRNGREDRNLTRLLESHLVLGIDMASRCIKEGPVLEYPTVAIPTFIDVIDSTLALVATHNVEPADKIVAPSHHLADDLNDIKDWLKTQEKLTK
jgi:hypothetical protein